MLASSWGCPTVDSISVIVKKKMKKKKIRLTVLCDGRSCRPRVSISRMRDVLGSTARVTWARMYFHGYSQPICDLTPVAGDGVLMQLNGDAAYSSEWDEWMNGSHTERRAHCLPPGRLSSAAYQLSTLQRGGTRRWPRPLSNTLSCVRIVAAVIPSKWSLMTHCCYCCWWWWRWRNSLMWVYVTVWLSNHLANLFLSTLCYSVLPVEPRPGRSRHWWAVAGCTYHEYPGRSPLSVSTCHEPMDSATTQHEALSWGRGRAGNRAGQVT